MKVELVRSQTSDGLRLDGALYDASRDTQSETLDAVICLSGVGSNFYGSTLIQDIVERLTEQGIAALSVNTRGHDGINTMSTTFGGKWQGAAFEIVDECRYDVTAWVDFLQRRGYQRVGLLGHSLGAIKVLYAQAHQPQVVVERLIAVSPPRLSHAHFTEGRGSVAFRESLRKAQLLVDQDESQTLFQANFPFPLIVSAATFLDKYGPDNRYNILRFAHKIQCDLTFIYGGSELTDGNSAFVNLVDELERLNWKAPRRPSIVTIPDANHFYSGHRAELLAEIERCIHARAAN